MSKLAASPASQHCKQCEEIHICFLVIGENGKHLLHFFCLIAEISDDSATSCKP